MRGQRTGGPEPHAAKDGWIAPGRARHNPAVKSSATPAVAFLFGESSMDENPLDQERVHPFRWITQQSTAPIGYTTGGHAF